MRPDQAAFLRNFYAVSFKNEHPITRRVIEAIPDDKADCHAGAAGCSGATLTATNQGKPE